MVHSVAMTYEQLGFTAVAELPLCEQCGRPTYCGQPMESKPSYARSLCVCTLAGPGRVRNIHTTSLACRDAAETQLASLQDRAQQLESELAGLREVQQALRRDRDDALAAEAAAAEAREAAVAAQLAAEQDAARAREARERAEANAQKAVVEAQRWVWGVLR